MIPNVIAKNEIRPSTVKYPLNIEKDALPFKENRLIFISVTINGYITGKLRIALN